MSLFKTFLASVIVALVSTTSFAAEPQTTTLSIEGMTCAGCPVTVKKVLKKIPGVSEASVDYKTAEAKVQFDPDKVQPEQLAKAVTEIGYPTTVKK